MAQDNQRRFPRVRGPFDGTWNGNSGRRTVRIVDFNLGGCYIDDLTRPTPNEAVQLAMRIPGDETPIEVQGRVLYLDGIQGFAVEFTDVDAATKARLQAAIERLAPSGT